MADHEGNGAESHCGEAPNAPSVPNVPPTLDPNQMIHMFNTFLRSMRTQVQDVGEGKPDKTIDQFLKMHPPRFSGAADPVAAEDWLNQMTIIFDGMFCPDKKRVSLITLILEGAASHWWQNELRLKFSGKTSYDVSWKDFCKLFRDWYIPQSAREKMREELYRLHQRNMSVSEYEQKFSELARYAPDMVSTEEQKCFMFRKGLRDSIRSNLIGFQFHDFSELVETAKRAEFEQQIIETHKGAQKRKKEMIRYGAPLLKKSSSGSEPSFETKSTTSGKSSFHNNPVCETCGRKHFGICWGADPGKSLRCYTCGEIGHISRFCPRNLSGSEGGKQVSNQEKGKTVGEISASSQGSSFPRSVGRSRGQGSATGSQGGPPRVYSILQQKEIYKPAENAEE